MTIRDTVIGIEKYALGDNIRYITYYPISGGGFEVVMCKSRGGEQRLATCDHEEHAKDIVTALTHANKDGLV